MPQTSSFEPFASIEIKSRAHYHSQREPNGKVKLIRGSWIRDAIEALVFFPRGQHDDQVDSIYERFR